MNPTPGYQQLLDILLGTTKGATSDIGLRAFLILMAVSLVSSVFISVLYLYFYQHRATGSQIQRAFPLLGLSVTAIFICVQFSLPLSLGLLGALSIVRFRTPIKEPEEIGFIMLVIASSIAIATFNLAFLAVILATAVAALLLMRFGPSLLRDTRKDGTLLLTLAPEEYRDKGEQILAALGRAFRQGRVEGVAQHGDQTVMTYSFAGWRGDNIAEVQRKLHDVARILDFHVYFQRPGAL